MQSIAIRLMSRGLMFGTFITTQVVARPDDVLELWELADVTRTLMRLSRLSAQLRSLANITNLFAGCFARGNCW